MVILLLQTCGILFMAGLLALGVLMIRGQRRRRQAGEAARKLGPAARASSAEQLRELQRAARASDMMETALRLGYFFLAVAAASAPDRRRPPGRGPQPWIDRALERVDEVVCGERLPVVPLHALAQRERVAEPVLRDAAILEGRDLGRQRNGPAFGTTADGPGNMR